MYLFTSVQITILVFFYNKIGSSVLCNSTNKLYKVEDKNININKDIGGNRELE